MKLERGCKRLESTRGCEDNANEKEGGEIGYRRS